MKQYNHCLEIILHHEGGYVNHPSDPGGETNLGVTKKVYDAYCQKNGLRTKDMKSLEVTDVAPIYKTEYWDRVKGEPARNARGGSQSSGWHPGKKGRNSL